jgi:hypothetical protein
MLVALEWAVRRREERWTTDHELAATSIELTHALLLTTLRVNGAKNVGKPMHVPRPWDKAPEKPRMLTMGEFARQVMGVANA